MSLCRSLSSFSLKGADLVRDALLLKLPITAEAHSRAFTTTDFMAFRFMRSCVCACCWAPRVFSSGPPSPSEAAPVSAAAGATDSASAAAPIIRIPDADPDAFLEVLRFLHSSRCVLTQDTCVPILELASRFGLPELTSLVGAQIEASVDVANVCSLLAAADKLGPPALRARCMAFALANMSAVKATGAFTALKAARPALAFEMLEAYVPNQAQAAQ